VEYCLEGLAAVASAQGQPERAARLCGTAAAVREASGTPRPPADRPSYEDTLAAVRAALGEIAFTTAWARGCSPSVEQALGEVLGEGAVTESE
jgi:hypothetical protein